VGGAMVGYYIGYQLYQSIGLWIIQTYGYQEQALKFQEIGKNWGFWIIALKSLTPIPFKVVTILSGATSMDFMTFVWGSLIGRGARFFIFCGLTWHFGPQLDDFLKKRMGLVIFLMFAIIIFGFLLIKVIL
jgi:membrane protein YqaA with SNARE-associated domain